MKCTYNYKGKQFQSIQQLDDFLLEKHEHSFKIFSKESIQIMDIKSEKRIKHEFEKA